MHAKCKNDTYLIKERHAMYSLKLMPAVLLQLALPQLFNRVKPILSRPHIKQTPSIKWIPD